MQVEAWDEDKLTKNDLIGRGVISLHGLVDPEASDFSVLLRKHGLPAGKITGKIAVVYDDAVLKEMK